MRLWCVEDSCLNFTYCRGNGCSVGIVMWFVDWFRDQCGGYSCRYKGWGSFGEHRNLGWIR